VEGLEDRSLLAGIVAEFPLPTPGAGPVGITTGPDGNLWATENATNQIAKITPAGVVTEFPIVTSGSDPAGITRGPDGNLWFTEQFGNKIGRITPAGAITEFPVPTANATLLGITAGPDGNLWFVESQPNQFGRITPAGALTEFPAPAGSQPAAIAAGPDGALWFTEAAGNKIGRLTTAGTVTGEFALPTPNSNPQGIAAGPDGALWFTEAAGNKVGRVTPAGAVTEFGVPTPVSNPQGIAAGPDGHLYFTEAAGNQVGRVSTSGTVSEISGLTAGSAPFGITAGPDGKLWFAERDGDRIANLAPPALTPTQAFVVRLYHDLLGRDAEPSGMAWWSGLVDGGTQTRAQIAAAIATSPEGLGRLVQNLYLGSLHRAADPPGLAQGVRFLSTGGTPCQLEAALMGSEEYLQTRGGGTPAGFVSALFQDTLGLAAGPPAQMMMAGLMAGGATRQQLALGVLTSVAYDVALAQAEYGQLLHHPADGASLAAAFGSLPEKRREELLGAVGAGILGSPEYLALSG
jgi:streptogramin lyase